MATKDHKTYPTFEEARQAAWDLKGFPAARAETKHLPDHPYANEYGMVWVVAGNPATPIYLRCSGEVE